jgi:hypothetical protein
MSSSLATFDALAALTAARPSLVGVKTAEAALGLRRFEMLHAGPPLIDTQRPPRVLESSIVMTCLHEGWARDAAEAEALLRSGSLTLMPAQDHRCVTPLAAIVSPSTPLFEVRGEGIGATSMFAPVSTVGGVDTRMGARDAGLLSRLTRRDVHVAPALRDVLARGDPIALWPLAAEGLALGDDLHSRTAEANAAFARLLRDRGAQAVADEVVAMPLFFLTLWMAASALVLRAAEGGDRPGLVTRAGGNGERFSIGLAATPGVWTSCVAEPPRGALLASAAPSTTVAGATGDSAVIDMLGLGGQRLARAPEPLAVFRDLLPADPESAARTLLAAPHPLLADGWPLGLDATNVTLLRNAPMVMLAMLAADGIGGFVGRGIYRPPVSLFGEALERNLQTSLEESP